MTLHQLGRGFVLSILSASLLAAAEPVAHKLARRDAIGTLSYVTNSGICETTPGVGQHSGYYNEGLNTSASSMFFWHFEARKNADTAPLVMWLGGGPGCSALDDLFDGNGPCQMGANDSEPQLNPLSWNNYATMLYIDQPIGAGFSHGADTYNSTVTAAPQIWRLLQAFVAEFPQYKGREFAIFSESYGGHYGPAFMSYIVRQNEAISAGSVKGEKINVVALGVNNGLFDYEIQFKSYIEFSYNNTYRQLINETEYKNLLSVYNSQCLPAISQCTLTAASGPCLSSYAVCSSSIMTPITSSSDFSQSDIRNADAPPAPFIAWITQDSIMKAIGASGTFEFCGSDPFQIMFNSGDLARPFVDELSFLVQSNVSVLIWAGDADWICNWRGCLSVATAIDYPESKDFNAAELTPWIVDGKTYGDYKSAGKLSYLKIYESGHLVVQDQPFAALQALTQTLEKGLASS